MSPDLHHLSGAYAVDALDDSERAAFEAHLTSCADCRAEVAELSAAAHAIAATIEVAPPPRLRAAVLGRIATTRPLPPLPGSADTDADDAPVPRRGAHAAPESAVVRLFRRPATWVAAAAAAALLAVGGLAWSPWSDGPGATPTLSAVQQVQRAADAKTVSSAAGELRTSVSWSPELGRSAISVEGLPPAPAGRTYQLWYIGRDDVVRSAGLFETAPDGTGEALLEGDANTAAAVGVSVEPAGGSPAPTTTPIVVLNLA